MRASISIREQILATGRTSGSQPRPVGINNFLSGVASILGEIGRTFIIVGGGTGKQDIHTALVAIGRADTAVRVGVSNG